MPAEARPIILSAIGGDRRAALRDLIREVALCGLQLGHLRRRRDFFLRLRAQPPQGWELLRYNGDLSELWGLVRIKERELAAVLVRRERCAQDLADYHAAMIAFGR